MAITMPLGNRHHRVRVLRPRPSSRVRPVRPWPYKIYKIYFDVSTGCLHFEIYQEDTRRVSVVRENKKNTKLLNICTQ